MTVFLIICDILIPLTMIVFGLMWRKYPPKSANCWYGFRTELSMKNADTWRFAHKYAANILFLWGVITFVLSVLIIIFANGIIVLSMWLWLPQLAVFIFTVVLTEKDLNRNFTKDGERK